MWVCQYIIEFMLLSCLGWVWETVYCTLDNKQWESRGFLFGPVCPIYGVGAIGGFALLDILKICGKDPLTWWQVLLIAFFGSAVLEYTTSYVLEKLFHAVWWDYSKMPLNINGRICLPASLGFALAGLLVVYVLYPWLHGWLAVWPPTVLALTAVVLTVIFTIDMTMTVTSLTDILHRIQRWDESINEQMTERVEGLYNNMNVVSRRVLSRIKEVRLKQPVQIRAFRKLLEKIKK